MASSTANTRSAKPTGSGLAFTAITPRPSEARRNTSPTEPVLSSTRLSTGSARSRKRHIRSSAKSGRMGATRSAIIARCWSRSRTNSRRFCQSTKDRADLRAVMRLPISAAMLSPPSCAASSRRRRRFASALPSASSTRITARRSGPSAIRLSRVTVFRDAGIWSAAPEPLEPPAVSPCVVDGVSGIAVAEVVLDEAQIVPLVGEREATGMAQRVWVHTQQTGTLGRHGDQVIDRLPGHGLTALGDEQPGQRVRAGGEIPAEGAQLVAGNRLLDRETALEAAYPQPGAVEVELVPAQAHGLADAQAVAVGHQQQKVVAHPVSTGLGGSEQPSHLGWRQVILGALVPVGGFANGDRPTLDLSPIGRLRRHRRNPLLAREAGSHTLDKRRFR